MSLNPDVVDKSKNAITELGPEKAFLRELRIRSPVGGENVDYIRLLRCGQERNNVQNPGPVAGIISCNNIIFVDNGYRH